MQDNVAFVSSHICFSANDTTSFFMAEKIHSVCKTYLVWENIQSLIPKYNNGSSYILNLS